MVPMTNTLDVPKTLRLGAKFYSADPGETIDVYRVDVPRLAAVGFVRAEGETPEDESTLDDLTVDELRDLARDAEIEGRSTMNRAELLSALASTTQE